MSAATRVAVASRSFSRHPVLRAELEARFGKAKFNDAGQSLSGEALVDFLAGHEKAITALERIDDSTLARLPQLRVIGKYGVGLDMLDLHAMARRGIKLGWTAGVNRRAVAELVIGFSIALLRHVPQSMDLARGAGWRQLMGRQLSNRTVGIVGCGHVGKELAVLLHAFGCRLLACDIRSFPEFYAAYGIQPLGLDDLLRQSDIVSLHLPLDASTKGLLSASRLALLRRDAVLINAARGELVDEAALKSMLISGSLAGAAFDVFANEPPQDLELLRLPNFIATPHIGGSAEEAVLAMGRAAIRGLDEAGDPLAVASM